MNVVTEVVARKWNLLIIGAVGQHLIDSQQHAALAAKAIAEALLAK